MLWKYLFARTQIFFFGSPRDENRAWKRLRIYSPSSNKQHYCWDSGPGLGPLHVSWNFDSFQWRYKWNGRCFALTLNTEEASEALIELWTQTAVTIRWRNYGLHIHPNAGHLKLNNILYSHYKRHGILFYFNKMESNKQTLDDEMVTT